MDIVPIPITIHMGELIRHNSADLQKTQKFLGDSVMHFMTSDAWPRIEDPGIDTAKLTRKLKRLVVNSIRQSEDSWLTSYLDIDVFWSVDESNRPTVVIALDVDTIAKLEHQVTPALPRDTLPYLH